MTIVNYILNLNFPEVIILQVISSIIRLFHQHKFLKILLVLLEMKIQSYIFW